MTTTFLQVSQNYGAKYSRKNLEAFKKFLRGAKIEHQAPSMGLGVTVKVAPDQKDAVEQNLAGYGASLKVENDPELEIMFTK